MMRWLSLFDAPRRSPSQPCDDPNVKAGRTATALSKVCRVYLERLKNGPATNRRTCRTRTRKLPTRISERTTESQRMYHYCFDQDLQDWAEQLPARLLPRDTRMTLQALENLITVWHSRITITDHFGSAEGLRGDLKQVAMEHRFAALGEVRAANAIVEEMRKRFRP